MAVGDKHTTAPAKAPANLALGALATAIGMASGGASAAVYTVTTLEPTGEGSLAEAIGFANGNSGTDTIGFSVTGTLDLAGTNLPSIADPNGRLYITGPGADDLTIIGNTAEGPVFSVGNSNDLTVSGLSITGAPEGVVDGSNYSKVDLINVNISGNTHSAALVRMSSPSAQLNVEDSTFDKNTATGVGYAVIEMSGSDFGTISGSTFSRNTSAVSTITAFSLGEGLTIEGSTISGNHSTSEGPAAIYADETDLQVRYSEITGNSSVAGAGALRARYGTLYISNSLFDGNSSTYGRGGAVSVRGGDVTIQSSSFLGNQASSAGSMYVRFNDGGDSLAIVGSSFIGNRATNNEGSGGAIWVNGTEGPSVSISDSVISDNVSDGGHGGIRVDGMGEFDVTSSLISGNQAEYGAGGLRAALEGYGSGTIDSSTISDNKSRYGSGGVDVDLDNYSSLTISDTTISDNRTTGGEGVSGLTVDLESYYAQASLTVSRTTISGNKGPGAAVEFDDFSGYYSEGHSVSVLNSTLSGNVSTDTRAPIVFDEVRSVTVDHSTFVNNAGAGTVDTQVHISGGYSYGPANDTSVTITNSAFASGNDTELLLNGASLPLAGGYAGTGGDMTVTITTTAFKEGFLAYGEGATSVTGAVGVDVLLVDPQLGPLADNGGPTMTHAPRDGDSNVIDTSEGQNRPGGMDQRGVLPAVGDLNGDLGAVEYVDPADNTAPKLVVNIGNQLSGKVGTVIPPFTVADAFEDAEGDNITVEVSGLPAGLTFDGTDISGELLVEGESLVIVTATDDGSPVLSTTAKFLVKVKEDSKPVFIDDDDSGSTPLAFFGTLAALAWLRRRRPQKG
jgi:hypothetical protein